MVMTRCRDVTIRFQASQVLDGPVRMIVQDGTVAISPNLERYFPDVLVKKAKICMKPNSFSPEKITRAKAAVELYKVDKILTPDYIIDSGEFVGTLRPKRYSSSSHSTQASAATQKKQLIVVAPSSAKEIKSLVKCNGKVKTILNDNFGLLEFCQDDTNTSYCLFDTFDLYCEGGRTAAQSKLTIANVLAPDMEVCFHACEISPGSSVPWLANGVWRPDTATYSKPVPHSKISKEKVSVFKKVAETCSVLVSSAMVPSASSAETVMNENSSSEVCVKGDVAGLGKKTEEMVNDVKTANLEGGEFQGRVEGMKTNLPPFEVKSEIESMCKENYEISSTAVNPSLEASVEVEAKLTNDESTTMEEEEVVIIGTKTIHGELKVAADLNNTGQSEKIEFDKDTDVEEKVEEIEFQVKKEVIDNPVLIDGRKDNFAVENEIVSNDEVVASNVEDVLKSDLLEVSTEWLSDQNTLGTLYKELSHKFAILSLNSPVGAKALLHFDRVWS